MLGSAPDRKGQSLCLVGIVFLVLLGAVVTAADEPLIINHDCSDITQIPEAAINAAKANLHIAYGHTSHGSQLTTGMSGLVAFANGGGLGLSLPTDIFEWNNGGTGGALDLHDYAMSGDCGYYPDWVNNTRNYLGPPDSLTGRGTNNSDVNVIIWSWCGQVPSKYNAGTLYTEYLTPMTQLENDYPGVAFIYMTQHTEHSAHASTTAGNQVIRDYCENNDKILYDFENIECYDPDGTFFEFPDDGCDYYESVGGAQLGNWAIEWQNAHTQDVDWYDCSSAHSQPLNANQKAYAAWWLWARLAGWNGPPTAAPDMGDFGAAMTLHQNHPNPFNPATRIRFSLDQDGYVSLAVYDVTGKHVRNLVQGEMTAAAYTREWDGRDSRGEMVSSGVYFYRLVSGQKSLARKMVLMK